MQKIFIYLTFSFLSFLPNLPSQDSTKIIEGKVKPANEKIEGFLGAYHPFKGKVYGGFGWKEDELIQKAFAFGENAVISQAAYSGYTFEENIINNCVKWNVNKLYGILRPPSENGKINQSGDTVLLKPFNYYPGMIQGAHRFSELSKKYPQICGLIIDDFYNDYPKDLSIEDLRDIKDALLGKQIDKNGNVDHSSKAETPNLKLYIVVYNHQLDRVNDEILKLIDGVSFWVWDQNNSYKNYGDFIKTIEETYPGKEIISGVYIYNSKEKEITTESIHYLINEAVNLYNKDIINGLLLFSPVWFSKENMAKQRWNNLALPKLLNKIYYKYLGEVEGKIVDEKTRIALKNSIVTLRKVSEKKDIKEITGKKLTNKFGYFQFGAWAGKQRKDIYEITFEKKYYRTKKIKIELSPGNITELPDIQLEKLN